MRGCFFSRLRRSCLRPSAKDESACGRRSSSSDARKNLWYPGYETLSYLRDLEYRLRQKANVNLYHVPKFSLYLSAPKLVALRKFYSIIIVLDCFYLFIFCFEKFWTWIWRLEMTKNLSIVSVNWTTQTWHANEKQGLTTDFLDTPSEWKI